MPRKETEKNIACLMELYKWTPEEVRLYYTKLSLATIRNIAQQFGNIPDAAKAAENHESRSKAHLDPLNMRLRKAYEEGATLAALAGRFRMSINTIKRRVLDAGGTMRPRGNP